MQVFAERFPILRVTIISLIVKKHPTRRREITIRKQTRGEKATMTSPCTRNVGFRCDRTDAARDNDFEEIPNWNCESFKWSLDGNGPETSKEKEKFRGLRGLREEI